MVKLAILSILSVFAGPEFEPQFKGSEIIALKTFDDKWTTPTGMVIGGLSGMVNKGRRFFMVTDSYGDGRSREVPPGFYEFQIFPNTKDMVQPIGHRSFLGPQGKPLEWYSGETQKPGDYHMQNFDTESIARWGDNFLVATEDRIAGHGRLILIDENGKILKNFDKLIPKELIAEMEFSREFEGNPDDVLEPANEETACLPCDGYTNPVVRFFGGTSSLGRYCKSQVKRQFENHKKTGEPFRAPRMSMGIYPEAWFLGEIEADFAGEVGAHKNSHFEAMDVSTKFDYVIAGVEKPLSQDDGAVRLLKFPMLSGKNNLGQPETYYYPLDERKGNGLVEMRILGPNRVLAMERSFDPTRRQGPNSIRIYEARLGANGQVQKALVTDLTTKHNLDNLESMQRTPWSYLGNPIYLFVSDNNYNPKQHTNFVFVALERNHDSGFYSR